MAIILRLISGLLTLAILSLGLTYVYYWVRERRVRLQVNALLAELTSQYQGFLRKQVSVLGGPENLDDHHIWAIKVQAETILRPTWEALAYQLSQYQPLEWPAPFLPKPAAPDLPALSQKVAQSMTQASNRLPLEVGPLSSQLAQAIDTDIETRLLAWKAGERLVF